MPTIAKARITSRTGIVRFAAGSLTTGNNASTPTEDQDSLTVEAPDSGVRLFDSVSQTGGNAVLRLRNIAGTGSISIAEVDGLITIHGIAPAPTSNALIAGNHLLANPRQTAGTATGVSLSDLLDLALGSDQGLILYRGVDGWTALAPGASGTTLQINAGDPTWQAIDFPTLPASLQYFPLICSISGAAGASQQVWTVPVVLPFTIPTNCAGSSGMASTFASSTAVFTLSYVRSGIETTLGTIVWAPATAAGTFTSTAYTAQVGDVLVLTAPPVVDHTLANVGIFILATRLT